MNKPLRTSGIALLAAILLAGCATKPSYSPPPERRLADRCPIYEVLVCTEQSPSRLDREDKHSQICRCENPALVR